MTGAAVMTVRSESPYATAVFRAAVDCARYRQPPAPLFDDQALELEWVDRPTARVLAQARVHLAGDVTRLAAIDGEDARACYEEVFERAA